LPLAGPSINRHECSKRLTTSRAGGMVTWCAMRPGAGIVSELAGASRS
jgi:hypothetical protein